MNKQQTSQAPEQQQIQQNREEQNQQEQENTQQNNNGNITNLTEKQMQPENEEQENQQIQQNNDLVQEGQVEEQQQQALPIKQQPKSNIKKQNYINNLQNTLSKTKQLLTNNIKALQQLTQDNKKTKQQLKKSRFDYLSSRRQISTLNQQKSTLQKQKNSLESKNKQLNEILQSYKEAGDINFFKNKITELENLINIQKQQLKMKEQMVDQSQEKKDVIVEIGNGKINILQMIEKYQDQSRRLNQTFSQISQINKQLQSQKNVILQQSTQLKLRLAQMQNQATFLRNANSQLEQRLKINESQLNKKIKQLQQAIHHLKSQTISSIQHAHLHEQMKVSNKNGPQKYGIKVIGPAQQRDIILKSYIQLQIKYQSANTQLQSLRQRHYNTLKQIKKMSSNFVQKKEYTQLYKKYCKLRKCLQNSLISEQNLKKQLQKTKKIMQNSNIIPNQQQAVQQKSKAPHQLKQRQNIRILQQPQNQLQKVQKIVQRSTQSYKQLFTMKQQLQMKRQIIKLQKSCKQKQDQLNHSRLQVQKLTNLLNLYDKDILYKKSQIQILRKFNQQSMSKINQLEASVVSQEQSQRLKSQLEQKNIMNQVLEVKYLQSIHENHQLINQKNMLSELYNNIKTIYEDLLNRQPQKQSVQQNQYVRSNQMINPENNQPCRKCQEYEEKMLAKKFNDVQSQSEGLGELYYKEIKQLLTILKKFPKKIDTVTTALENQKSTINQVKKRFDHVSQTYGAKARQLDQQRKSNDQWRLKQKEQIREQYQQIRDFLLNQRLINAIRKAKSLIQYYEQTYPEGQENAQQGQEGQNNQNEKQGGQQIVQQNP